MALLTESERTVEKHGQDKLLVREIAIQGAFAREQSQEEIWVAPCYCFFFLLSRLFAHLIRAKTNLLKSNQFHFRWWQMNTISTTLHVKQGFVDKPGNLPIVYNIVSLRVWSGVLTSQLPLQSTAQCAVRKSWGSGVRRDKRAWQLSPSHASGMWWRARWQGDAEGHSKQGCFAARRLTPHLAEVSFSWARVDLQVSRGFSWDGFTSRIKTGWDTGRNIPLYTSYP